MTTQIFLVSGMTCGGCVRTVETIIKKQPGVESVAVELTPGQATITFDSSQISPLQIADALAKMGYQMHTTP